MVESTDMPGTPDRADDPEAPQPAARAGRRVLANADPVSVAAGLIFLVLGGAYLLAAGGHVRVNAGWTVSLLATGLGLCGVLGSVPAWRRR